MVRPMKPQSRREPSPRGEGAPGSAGEPEMAPYVTALPSVSDVPRQELRKGFGLHLSRRAAAQRGTI